MFDKSREGSIKTGENSEGNPGEVGVGVGEGDKPLTPSTDRALNVTKKIAYSHLIRD